MFEYHGLAFVSCECPNGGCTNVDTSPVSLGYPATTTDGRPTIDYVQAALAKAWAGHEGTVDLWVRTGCNGAREARYLFESVELFWPRGVGKIIVVLDVADATIVGDIVPTETAHAYDVRFEHVPCMPARVFNQVSYLMGDHHLTADVIVTIDASSFGTAASDSPTRPRSRRARGMR